MVERDRRGKCLINLALVPLRRCGSCVDNHLNKARKLGIPDAELEEAVWCAVAIGGACVRVFCDHGISRRSRDEHDDRPTCC